MNKKIKIASPLSLFLRSLFVSCSILSDFLDGFSAMNPDSFPFQEHQYCWRILDLFLVDLAFFHEVCVFLVEDIDLGILEVRVSVENF